MKHLHLAICFLAGLLPVAAAAQATRTIPLGKNFGIDSKIPVEFNAEEFNEKFIKQMNALRAQKALRSAPQQLGNLPAASETEPDADETDYTKCIICREKILKSDGYQLTPKRDWYVKKHSPCACEFYKGWKKSEDMSFLQTAQARKTCENYMDNKYELHTCAICGQPINAACGAVSTWEDSLGKHYSHADCFQARRHAAAKTALLKGLDITQEDCSRFEQQKQTQRNAQKELMEEMQKSSEQIRRQSPADAAVAGTRSFQKVSRDLKRFNRRHGKALQKAVNARKDGQMLTSRQQDLIRRFETLREEYKHASKASL